MELIRQIKIQTSFPAIHAWEGCPLETVRFLKHPHRHVFHMTIVCEVSHNDRDIEFIDLKMQIENEIDKAWKNKNLGQTSCEDIAEYFLKMFNAVYVEVLEDNENGAILQIKK